MDKVVFLDRDGVINRRNMQGYVWTPKVFHILDGVLPALARLSEAEYRLAVVTNQRGIARGLYGVEDVHNLHLWFSRQAAKWGAKIDEFYVCPHDRDSGCSCRKPRSGLLDQADSFRSVDWSRSFLVGDSDSDLIAGKARGVKVIKVGDLEGVQPDFIASDLAGAVEIILSSAQVNRA